MSEIVSISEKRSKVKQRRGGGTLSFSINEEDEEDEENENCKF